MRVGFVVAMDSEYSPFLDKLGSLLETHVVAGVEVCRYFFEGKDVFLAKCGIGEIASSAATALLIGKFDCNYIVNFGLVGAFDPSLRGALVAVRDVVHYDSDITAFGHALGAPADFTNPFLSADPDMFPFFSEYGLPLVRLASGDKFIADRVFSEKIATSFSADICDMEGAGIALVCVRSRVSFTMIKLVSDGADDSAAADFGESKRRAFGRAFEVVLDVIRRA